MTIRTLFLLLILFRNTLLVSSLSQSSNRTPNTSQQRRKESLEVGNNPLLSLNLNLDALARAEAAERAQELYQRIAALHREGYYAVSPDTCSFNSVLKAWKSDPAKALEFWETAVNDIEPNVRSFNTVLLALANAGLYEEAESVLRQMQSPDSPVIPDRISYNTVLLSYVASQEPNAPERAEVLLREMLESDYLQPDAISYNIVVQAHLNDISEKAAEKAQEWVERMRQDGVVKPDVYTYTLIIQAWAQLGNPERAFELLKEMNDVQPNRVTYTAVLQAYCHAKQPQKAQQLLEDMIQLSDQYPEVRPDCVTFSALIDGWAVVAEEQPEQAVEAALSLLQRMQDLSSSWPETAPNARTYTSVLTTLARSRQWEACHQAFQLLRDMSSSEPPNLIHYNAVLDAYAKSPRADKAIHALKVWNHMKQNGVVGDSISYNSILAASANAFGQSQLKEDSLKVGLMAFQALKKDENCQATSFTYLCLFKAIRKGMTPSTQRTKLVRQVFGLLCQDGCLNDIVWKQLMHFANDIADLVGERYGTLDRVRPQDLPSEWTRNAMPIRQSAQINS